MSFELHPNAKYSILMFASRKFQTFKTMLTHKYILMFKDQPSFLQHPLKIFCYINPFIVFLNPNLKREGIKVVGRRIRTKHLELLCTHFRFRFRQEA